MCAIIHIKTNSYATPLVSTMIPFSHDTVLWKYAMLRMLSESCIDTSVRPAKDPPRITNQSALQ